ncbi:MAG: Uma2 family endonuclease [Symploca sp. SIO3C6]|uniref:Uma2 family endonuclease n=1 Tax=Symploca sp. SIO1C4 TaxID=2607765 RepID=A0A6B3NBD6_9CYAN|nr:Uma2 family endonuclease [Symploca sp. SIO3C6]NER28987.1 Uma2 family endonuclease [Symploca sp. SIO1C4]NET08048.1 Uma2 family endonuclease [Symploca sp. SIO2B6]
MNTLPTRIKIISDTWITATWDEYIQATENPDYDKAKFYYNNGKLRIEMSPLGNDHASDHSIITYALNLYATVKEINLNGKDNCTYRKTGYQDAQPDLSYYIGEKVDAIPYGTSIIKLDNFPPPTLVIEIANTSLADDKGEKRLLYENLEVQEYWIVDVQDIEIIAFAVENEGSRRIRSSQVLPKLKISLLEEALRRTRKTNHSKVGAWLLEQFQQ